MVLLSFSVLFVVRLSLGCNQARRDSTWFTDTVPSDASKFHSDRPGLECWECDGSFIKHERRTCLRFGEKKQLCDSSVNYCELRVRVGYRNYMYQNRGDSPGELQVTWRGCARDWITEDDPFNNDGGYKEDPSYPKGMKCKVTGVWRSDDIKPGEEELHCLCKDDLCNEHIVVLGEWGEFTYSASIVFGCFIGVLILFVLTCFVCGLAN